MKEIRGVTLLAAGGAEILLDGRATAATCLKLLWHDTVVIQDIRRNCRGVFVKKRSLLPTVSRSRDFMEERLASVLKEFPGWVDKDRSRVPNGAENLCVHLKPVRSANVRASRIVEIFNHLQLDYYLEYVNGSFTIADFLPKEKEADREQARARDNNQRDDNQRENRMKSLELQDYHYKTLDNIVSIAQREYYNARLAVLSTIRIADNAPVALLCVVTDADDDTDPSITPLAELLEEGGIAGYEDPSTNLSGGRI